MLPLSEFVTPFGVSVGIATAVITAAVCMSRGNYVYAVQLSLPVILGHFLSQFALFVFPQTHSAGLRTFLSAAVTLACNALFMALDIAVPESFVKELDNNDILNLFAIIFTLFEGYQIYLFIASVSEDIRSFLARKVHLSLSRDAALPYFVVLFAATVAGYVVSAIALFDAYGHISSVAVSGDDGTLHVMVIAAVAALSVVITAYSYSNGGIGLQFSTMITVYASLVVRKGALSVKAVEVPSSGFMKVLTSVVGAFSRALSGDEPNRFAGELSWWDMVEVGVHVVAVAMIVLCPQSFMRRRIRWEKALDVVVMRTLVSSLVLLGLMSTLIASLATYTHTKEPSFVWRYGQCGIVLLAGVFYASN